MFSHRKIDYRYRTHSSGDSGQARAMGRAWRDHRGGRGLLGLLSHNSSHSSMGPSMLARQPSLLVSVQLSSTWQRSYARS